METTSNNRVLFVDENEINGESLQKFFDERKLPAGVAIIVGVVDTKNPDWCQLVIAEKNPITGVSDMNVLKGWATDRFSIHREPVTANIKEFAKDIEGMPLQTLLQQIFNQKGKKITVKPKSVQYVEDTTPENSEQPARKNRKGENLVEKTTGREVYVHTSIVDTINRKDVILEKVLESEWTPQEDAVSLPFGNRLRDLADVNLG